MRECVYIIYVYVADARRDWLDESGQTKKTIQHQRGLEAFIFDSWFGLFFFPRLKSYFDAKITLTVDLLRHSNVTLEEAHTVASISLNKTARLFFPPHIICNYLERCVVAERMIRETRGRFHCAVYSLHVAANCEGGRGEEKREPTTLHALYIYAYVHIYILYIYVNWQEECL